MPRRRSGRSRHGVRRAPRGRRAADGGRRRDVGRLRAARRRRSSRSRSAPADGAVYAGTEPSALYRSDDGGETWRELDGAARASRRGRRGASRRGRGRRTSAGSRRARTTPNVLLVGIELGGLMRSTDGGETLGGPPARRAARRPLARLASGRPRGARTRRAAAGRRGARTAARRGSRPTRAATATTRGRSPSTPTIPTLWYVSASTGPFAAHGSAATRRRTSTGARDGGCGSRSPAGFRIRSRRCRTRSSRPRAGSSPGSRTASSGRAPTAGTPGARASSTSHFRGWSRSPTPCLVVLALVVRADVLLPQERSRKTTATLSRRTTTAMARTM